MKQGIEKALRESLPHGDSCIGTEAGSHAQTEAECVEDPRAEGQAQRRKDMCGERKGREGEKTKMLSKHWSSATIHGHVAGKKKNRLDMLERLKLGSRDLPEHLESSWPRIKVWYESDVVKKHPANHGVVLITMVNSVLEQLGEHYQFALKFKSTETRHIEFTRFLHVGL